MPKIKIIQINVLETDETRIQNHLTEFLRDLRKRKMARDLLGDDDRTAEFDAKDFEQFKDQMPDGVQLTYKDRARITARAKCLASKRERAQGTAHLSREDRARLDPRHAEMEVIVAPSVHWADEIAASLHAQMPWMAPATEAAWHDLRSAAQRGMPIKIGPMMLDGPPGIGKSVWARSLADLLKLPVVKIDAAAGGAGFELAGVERGWGTALPGRPVELLLDRRIANPIFIVDEICKAKAGTSTKGMAFSLTDTMLGLLEPATAKTWTCPYFRVAFDMSHISWIFTSNTLENVPEVLRSRCKIVEIPDITEDVLRDFAQRRGTEMGLSAASLDAIATALTKACRIPGRRQSLRDVIRMLSLAEALEGRPPVQ